MQKLVGIKFSATGKVYSFDPNGLELNIGDKVVVDSEVGVSYAEVATKIKEVEKLDIVEPLKVVIRKATDADEKKNKELCEKARKDIVIIKEKVKALELEMKIVSATYCLDGSKIIIEFSAEERVDFRDLLKELASTLKVRIELHQVGQRDEVKIKGGIGPCGEICCCARFLKDFEHVTVKMAKNQGLSLSPTKISGLCGRLMCCLAYENSAYEEILKKMPKVNSEITCPNGVGTVVYNDILRERVSVKVKNADESFVVYDYALSELEGKPAVGGKEQPSKESEEKAKPIEENKERSKEEVVKEENKQKNNGPKKKFNKHFNKNKGEKK